MARIKLYVDEDAMGRPLIRTLKSNGVDVITASDVDMVSKDDEQHLEYATFLGRVLYSYNVRDYPSLNIRFWEEGRIHSGIVLAANSRYDVGEQLRRLLNLIDKRSAEEMVGQIEYLGGWA
jgi:hypothetical protein